MDFLKVYNKNKSNIGSIHFKNVETWGYNRFFHVFGIYGKIFFNKR